MQQIIIGVLTAPRIRRGLDFYGLVDLDGRRLRLVDSVCCEGTGSHVGLVVAGKRHLASSFVETGTFEHITKITAKVEGKILLAELGRRGGSVGGICQTSRSAGIMVVLQRRLGRQGRRR